MFFFQKDYSLGITGAIGAQLGTATKIPDAVITRIKRKRQADWL